MLFFKLTKRMSVSQLVSVEDYERWLQRGLSVAESRCEGSYHCATADCPGWCVYEDTVNTFHCPVCKKHNCLLCKVNCPMLKHTVMQRPKYEYTKICKMVEVIFVILKKIFDNTISPQFYSLFHLLYNSYYLC